MDDIRSIVEITREIGDKCLIMNKDGGRLRGSLKKDGNNLVIFIGAPD
jgi:hypothetical protein